MILKPYKCMYSKYFLSSLRRNFTIILVYCYIIIIIIVTLLQFITVNCIIQTYYSVIFCISEKQKSVTYVCQVIAYVGQ